MQIDKKMMNNHRYYYYCDVCNHHHSRKFAEMSIEWADTILSDDLRDLHGFS